jgi:hypothetical protein
MSYKYLGLKRLKNAMQLGLTEVAKSEFDPVPLRLWLLNTHEHYELSNIRSVLADEAQAFLNEHADTTDQAMAGLSKAGRLLMDAVLHACKMPVRGDLDQNLDLIVRAYAYAQELEKYPVEKLSIKYSLKKHRDDKKLRLMTVRSAVLKEFGLEASGLCLSALREALSREMDLKISIWNVLEVYGSDYREYRVAPAYVDVLTFLARTDFVQYVCKVMTTEQIKENYGVIKAVCQFFETLQVPQK